MVVPTTADVPMTPRSGSIRCIDPPLPLAQPVALPYNSATIALQVAALGEVESVAAVGAENDVIGPQRLADADGDGFLADRQVDGAFDPVGGVDAGDFLFQLADAVQ